MNKVISLNKVFEIINLLFLIISCSLFAINGANEYINIWTVVLSILLNLETIFFLRFSEKYNNSLIFILSFVLTIFYSFRVITLAYIPFSFPFLRYKTTPFDINYALIFIIISSFFLFLGIKIRKNHTHQIITSQKKLILFKPTNAIIIIAFSLLIMFSISLEGTLFSIIRGYLSTLFINSMYLLLAGFVFYLYYKDTLNKKTKLLFFFCLIVFIMGQMLSGSRSALLSGILIILFGSLSLNRIIYLKLKYILVVVIIIPLSIVFFILSTFLRKNNARESSINEKIEVFKLYESDYRIEILLAPVFDRIGFLDYATGMISNRHIYSKAINPLYYTKSLVDNVLTPGFNIFDTPKASNALIFLYNQRGTPSLKAMNEGNYQSDQMTIFGEFYILLGGWFSIIYFFLFGYYFQKATTTSPPNEFSYYLRNSFIFNAFYILINSFGLDWFVFNVLSFYIAYILFLFILRLNLKFN